LLTGLQFEWQEIDDNRATAPRIGGKRFLGREFV